MSAKEGEGASARYALHLATLQPTAWQATEHVVPEQDLICELVQDADEPPTLQTVLPEYWLQRVFRPCRTQVSG